MLTIFLGNESVNVRNYAIRIRKSTHRRNLLAQAIAL